TSSCSCVHRKSFSVVLTHQHKVAEQESAIDAGDSAGGPHLHAVGHSASRPQQFWRGGLQDQQCVSHPTKRFNAAQLKIGSVPEHQSKVSYVGAIPSCVVGLDEDYCYTFLYAPASANPDDPVETIVRNVRE